jgi:hypothetical protein
MECGYGKSGASVQAPGPSLHKLLARNVRCEGLILGFEAV